MFFTTHRINLLLGKINPCNLHQPRDKRRDYTCIQKQRLQRPMAEYNGLLSRVSQFKPETPVRLALRAHLTIQQFYLVFLL